MAVVLAESVAITKSRLAKGFNGDNLNLNGKVISIEEADAGFKAAGKVKPPYIAVLSSGNQKGFASGAAVAFNDYVKDINLNKYNAEAVISRYFDDMQTVVEKCNIEGGRLSIGIICVYDDCIIAAKTGENHLLRFSEGELFEIALSDDEAGRGFQFIDVISDGDMFALIGEEASAELDYDAIVNAFDSEGDLKEKIKDFYKLLSASARGKDCSVVLVKLHCDSERTYAAAPLVSNDAENADIPVSPDKFAAEPPVNNEELRKANDYVSDDDMPATGKNAVWSKKKLLQFIPIAVLVVILAITAALFLATRRPQPTGPSSEGESGTTQSGSLDSIFNENMTSSDEKYTGDFNGSNGMQDVEDLENGGSVDRPGNENTDPEPEEPTEGNTTQQEKPTEENTTDSSEETTTGDSSEETTADSGETDTTAETTTAEADTTEASGGENSEEPAGEPTGEPMSI